MQALVLVVIGWLGVGALVFAWTSGRTIVSFWREPVLKRPVLIVESDDWGAGPPEQAEWLARIAGILDTFADRDGRKPVMTLGLVLAVARGTKILTDELRNYYRTSLDDPEFAPILAAIRYGAERGVFCLQLHGGEHYWPAALLAAARQDPAVSAWMSESGAPRTEDLPAGLQSRWVDASTLPSKPLSSAALAKAALAEAEEFRRIVGREPTVAVPPTFIWNDAVEAAWAGGGVRYVVTPGRRFEARGGDGEPAAGGSPLVNGDKGRAGLVYLVRDIYFEPSRGHKAERALEGLAAKTRVGRPTLLETHRANFLGDEEAAAAATRELERLLATALKRFPDLAFLSTEELASRMGRRDSPLIENRLPARIQVWLRRLWQIGRLRKLAWVTGAVIPGSLVYAVSRLAGPAALRA